MCQTNVASVGSTIKTTQKHGIFKYLNNISKTQLGTANFLTLRFNSVYIVSSSEIMFLGSAPFCCFVSTY